MVKKANLIIFAVMLFPIMHLINMNIDSNIGTICSYYDEIVGCASAIYITMLALNKRLLNADKIIYFVLVCITVLGVVSNVFSRLGQDVFAILVDIVALWKPFACFLAFKHLAIDCFNEIIKKTVSIVRLIILFVTAVAIIGQFVDIGVTREVSDFGTKTFVFYWDNTLHTGWLLYCCVLVLSASSVSQREFYFYLVLSYIPLFLTGSFTVICWMLLEFLLLILLKRKQSLKKSQVVLLSIPIILTSAADISKYLLSDTAPRAKLIKGGIQVANQYFPFGSGFATYGSEMASRYYSQIYRQFGWAHSWGLGIKDGQYLNDNFFASIVGQFGWIGLLLYVVGLVKVFENVNSKLLCKRERATALAIVLTIAASMIISATGKSALGMFAFAFLGITAAHVEACKYQRNENKTLGEHTSIKKSKYIRGNI